MRIEEYVDALREEGIGLAKAAERAGLEAGVPTCPQWRVRDLLHHIGGVHRWAASFVATGRTEPYTRDEEKVFFVAPPDPGLLPWFREGHQRLVNVLSAADPDIACWAFFPGPSPLTFWARRQAHETAIHRADAESATSATPAWPPAFAADGIDELLSSFLALPGGRLVADPPASICVRATDVAAAWTIRLEPDGRRISPGEQPADLTLTGPASDLYLLLWNRATADRITAAGDRALLELWRDAVRIRWV